MKKTIPFLFSVSLGLLLVTGAVRSQANTQTEISLDKLVNTLRILNTEEVMYLKETGRFAAKEEMLSFLKKKDYLKSVPIDLENPRVVELGITVSLDGTHYQLGIKQPFDQHDMTTHCKMAAFSDDSGVIYLGAALGCEESK